MRRFKNLLVESIGGTLGIFYKDTRRVRCFTYHDISNSIINKYTLEKSVFIQHIKILHENMYKTITSDFFQYDWKTKLQDEKNVCITFDDGFESNLFAADLLLENKLNAIFFITTSFVGKNEYLDWNQIKEISNSGFEIGSHSHTHCNLRTLTKQKVFDELSISKDILQNKLGIEIKSFSYPYGKKNTYDEIVIDAVKVAGYSVAYTQNGGPINKNINLFKIPRIGINSTDDINIFKRKIEGYYDLFENFTRLP